MPLMYHSGRARAPARTSAHRSARARARTAQSVAVRLTQQFSPPSPQRHPSNCGQATGTSDLFPSHPGQAAGHADRILAYMWTATAPHPLSHPPLPSPDRLLSETDRHSLCLRVDGQTDGDAGFACMQTAMAPIPSRTQAASIPSHPTHTHTHTHRQTETEQKPALPACRRPWPRPARRWPPQDHEARHRRVDRQADRHV